MKILRKILGVALIAGPGIAAVAMLSEHIGMTFITIMLAWAIVLAIGFLAIIGTALLEYDDKEGT